MSQRTDAQLTTEKDTIENETTEGANTVTRVGDMFENIIDSKVNNDKIDTADTLDTAGKTVPGRDAVKAYIAANAGGGTFASITGDPYDNAALKAALDAKADTEVTLSADPAGAHTLNNTDLTAVNEGKNYVALTSVPGVLTIPLNATVDFPIGPLIGADGFTTMAGAVGVTINGTNGTLDVVGRSYFEQLSTNNWILYNGEPDASETVKGLVELATTAEVVTGTDTSRATTAAGVKAAIDALIAAAPGALDTLNELAAALGDDPNFATTVTNALALKAPLASPTLTGTPASPTASQGTNTTQVATTAFVVAEIAAVVVGVQDLYIPSSAMWPRSTGGCAGLAQAEIATSLVNLQTLDFDQTTQEFAQFTLSLPRNWNNGTITAKVYWTAISGTGTVQWGISGGAYSNDDALTVALGTAQTVDDTLLATSDLHITDATSAITLAGTPADADFLAIQISRNPASDTLNADAKLIGIVISLTTDAAKAA